MALLATQPVTRAGTVPSYTAAAGGGDTLTPDKNTLLHVKNGGGAPITVTITTPLNDQIGNPVADNAVTVANASEKMIGPFPREFYADPTTAVTSVAYSAVTSVTVAVLQLTQP